MLLALTRLWDTNEQGIRMDWVWTTLRDKEVIEALALDRAQRRGWLEDLNEMKNDLSKKAAEAVLLLNKYREGGTQCMTRKNLLTLRHERLAHHQIAARASRASATDNEIEAFYQDHSKLIAILLGVVHAMAYDPQDTAKVFGFYASHFWKRVT